MGKLRTRTSRGPSTGKVIGREDNLAKMNRKKITHTEADIDVEQMLKSNVICTGDGSSRTCLGESGIRNVDSSQRTYSRTSPRARKRLEDKKLDQTQADTETPSPNLTRTLRVSIRRLNQQQSVNQNQSSVPLVNVNVVKDQLKLLLNKREETLSELSISSDENFAKESKDNQSVPELNESRQLSKSNSELETFASQITSVATIEDHLKSPQRSKNILKQLESSLSPKYMNPNTASTGLPTSRYGRIRKQKENNDYIPLDVAKFITKSPAKMKLIKKEFEDEIPPVVQTQPKLEPSTQSSTDLNSSPNKARQTSLEANAKLLDTSISSDAFPSDEFSDIPCSVEPVEHEDLCAAYEDNMSESIPIIDPNASLVGIDKIQIIDMDASFGESIISAAPSIPVTEEVEVYTTERQPESNIVNLPAPVLGIAEENDNLYPGQMLWGAFNSKTPHWPCMLSPDPEDSQIRKLFKKPMLHVKFFADNGRRAWIPETQVLPYCNVEQYKEIVNSQFRHLRYKLVPYMRRETWLEAIRQAEDVQNQPIEAREKRYDELLEEDRAKAKPYVRRRAKSVSLGYHSNSFNESNEYNRKRLRSPTPESPAYEELPTGSKSTESLSKRIKLDTDQDLFRNTISRYFQSMAEGSEMAETASGTSSECDDITEMLESDKEIYNNFLNISRLYVFEGQTETEVDRKLQKYVQKICALRMHSIANGARLSSRLRSQALRKLGEELGIDKGKKGSGSPASSSAVEVKPKPKKVQKNLEEQFVFELEKNYLMKGVPRGSVCVVCIKPNDLVKCSKCYNFYHSACLTDVPMKTERAEASKAFICTDCILQKPATCFVCHDQENAVKEELKYRCVMNGCGKYYHLPCLRLFPQHKFTGTSKSSTLFCPYHTCHTCISDDPRSNATTTKGHLIRCIKCPSSYHTEAKCVPAGSQILSNGAMICPKHNLEQSCLNVNWCFLCCKGGSLICCETCPTAFHLACLKFTPPEGKYICEECESGRMPLYNEIVWAKFGAFRFWPAITVPPPKVPENIEHLPHEKWDICVRFFGTYNHVWLNRRRIYLYQEGDSDTVESRRTGIAKRYGEALQEAKKIHAILLARKTAEQLSDVGEGSFKPPMYVKIKSNRYVAPLKAPYQGKEDMDNSVCECRATDDDPCGPESNCINRVLLVECNPKVCPAGERCLNQCFEKKQYPQLIAKRISQKGWGLVAMEDIRQGQFVIEYIGEVINNEELDRRLQHKVAQKDENYYFLTVDSELTIDAGPKGNLARFINHSCEPNCETMLWTVGGAQSVGLFAIKDIKKGEELTFNYNFESKGSDKKICHCNASKCSGFIGQKYRPPLEDASSSSGLNKRRKSTKNEKGVKHRRRSSAAASAKRRKSKDATAESGKRKKDPVAINVGPTEPMDNETNNKNVDRPVEANTASEIAKTKGEPISPKSISESAE